MFASLRARLWLSYAVLIVVLLCVVAATLVFSLLQNPLVYRSVTPRLQQEQRAALPLAVQAVRAGADRVQALLEAEAEASGLRLLVTDRSGSVIADSGAQTDSAMIGFSVIRLAYLEETARPGLARDASRRVWLYMPSQIGASGQYLLVAMLPPRLTLVNVLRNEVLAPIVISGAAAIAISFVLALLMSNWIASPLQRMAQSAHRLAEGKAAALPVEGPSEVKELARALNDMSRQINAGQQSQRDFVANVSHELKTPLTSIQGFAQAILDGTARTPETLKEAAGVIYHESMRMYRLVLDLLTLTRLEGGTADLQHSPVDLGALLKGVVDRFAIQADKAQVTLDDQAAGWPPVNGDGDRLAQVFNNLVDNALKFTPAGGRIVIHGNVQGNFALVEVADTGKGIAAEDRERIFERFYQADKSRRGGEERGAGLGLPIARQIVLAHGGKLWVESVPGQGSRFYVQLPLARPSDPTQPNRRVVS